MPLTYNRCAPPELMGPLMKDGWAHSLVEYAQSRQYAIDLQLRGYEGRPGHWATLYVGLTKVLDLRNTGNRYRLTAHETYRLKKHGWNDGWTKLQPGDRLAEQWHAVEEYLERVIPSVAPRFLKEGGFQTAICGFAGQEMVVIDRESSVSFSNVKEKQAITQALSRPLLDAVASTNGAAWWNSRPQKTRRRVRRTGGGAQR